MKAGLVTFYHIHHYGALLQAAATERAVERFGWDCEIIDYFVNQDNALFKRPTGLGSAAHDAHTALHYQALSERYRRFEKFSRDHLRISDRRYGRFDELAEGPLPYDLILSGSDQIWNPKIFPDGRFDPVFFGTFSQKRRIAYAPSFGVPTIPEGMQAELKGYLDGFSYLSARETQGSAIIRDIAGKDAPVVLDPTLLLTADQWASMADHPANYPKGGYILCYCISRPGALTPYLCSFVVSARRSIPRRSRSWMPVRRNFWACSRMPPMLSPIPSMARCSPSSSTGPFSPRSPRRSCPPRNGPGR